ncbi:hypothetical protein ILUMI_01741 [Ignelater luminosus]|uniref:Mutator-like transposase domain-containing protein n=1 Tax=Ignelater luminosus TaxID=2038154 RepID=A0A8K0DJK6_IGNLU|nr:hypothetical protein ILUMI_01741 [Ignelater luminosus]
MAAVIGCVSVGIGHIQLNEFCASLDMPEENKKLMKEAAAEEARLALERGDIDKNGTPVISVIVDGAWSKRSYRTNYNASSGVETISIGLHSTIYKKISQINERLVINAESLLYNVDTNSAETYNSVVAKFVGGKRINYSLKGSYETRCKAAAISFNSKGNFLDIIYGSADDSVTGYYTKSFLKKREKQQLRTKKTNM